jgi:cytochrome P450
MMQTSAAGPNSPGFVTLWHAYRRPLAYLEDCARRYGDCFTLRIPTFPAPITFVSDPDAIKESSRPMAPTRSSQVRSPRR